MRFQTVLISVTEKCHVGCAHCGFIGAVREREPEPHDMADWVKQVCEYGVPKVIFTGGEPFERFDCLALGVRTAEEANIPAAVFTSSFWATDRQTTLTTLSKLPGLKHLYLSTDVFHQKRVPYQNVFNAIEIADELNIPVITMCITYANEDDRDEVKSHYQKYGNRVGYSIERVIPNPKIPAKLLRPHGQTLSPSPENFRCKCEIGTPIINPNGDVFSCHIGKAAAHGNLRELPYFLGNLYEARFAEIMQQAAARPEYQFLRTLGPRGVAGLYKVVPSLLESVGRKGFNNECDMCFYTLSNPEGRKALATHVAKQEVIDKININLTLVKGEPPLPSPASQNQ